MVQLVRQTWQERYEMYMKMPKEELAKMLAETAKVTNPDGCSEFAYMNEYDEYSASTLTSCCKSYAETYENCEQNTAIMKDDFIFWR